MNAQTPRPETTLARALARERFGVVLSAGYYGFFAHAGFLAAVEGAGLSSAAYGGTSAGALIAALAASGLDAGRIRERLLRLRRSDFWDPAPLGTLLDAARGRGITGMLAGARFRALLEEVLPVARIEDCLRPLVLVSTDVSGARPRIHDRGPLAEAVHASCAYPGLFRAVRSGDAQLWDGGLVDKAPLLALAERVELDSLLVHYLPSASRKEGKTRGHGYLAAMGRALAAVRHEHFELQARLLEARGVKVYVVAPDLPAVSPQHLAAGRGVIDEACAEGARVLARPAELSRPFAAEAAGAGRPVTP